MTDSPYRTGSDKWLSVTHENDPTVRYCQRVMELLFDKHACATIGRSAPFDFGVYGLFKEQIAAAQLKAIEHGADAEECAREIAKNLARALEGMPRQ